MIKKGSRDKPGNCRPVNLTPVAGKRMEKNLKDRIDVYLERQ